MDDPEFQSIKPTSRAFWIPCRGQGARARARVGRWSRMGEQAHGGVNMYRQVLWPSRCGQMRSTRLWGSKTRPPPLLPARPPCGQAAGRGAGPHLQAVVHGQVERGHAAGRVAERNKGLKGRQGPVGLVRGPVQVDDLEQADLRTQHIHMARMACMCGRVSALHSSRARRAPSAHPAGTRTAAAHRQGASPVACAGTQGRAAATVG